MHAFSLTNNTNKLVARAEKWQQQNAQAKDQWIFGTSKLHDKCCEVCTTVITGFEMQGFANEFLGRRLTNDFCIFQNEKRFHDVISDIMEVSSPLEQFSRLREKFCSGDYTENQKLHLFSLFERIFLRCICYKYGNIFFSQKEVSTIQLLSTAALAYVASADVASCFTTLDDVFRTSDDGKIIANLLSVVNASAYSDVELFRQAIACRILQGKIPSFIAKSLRDQTCVFKGKNIMVDFLNGELDNINKLSSSNDFNMIPNSIIELVGKPGSGKSMSVRALSILLQSFFPFLGYDDLVYSRANDYWWNGYKGQPIVLYDDFTHARRLKFDFVREIIDIGSGVMQTVPMAFIKDMKFTSFLTIITSNIPFMTKVPEASVDAVRRRMDSSVWKPLVGVAEETHGIYKYNTMGYLLNSITNGDLTCFDLFKNIFKKKRKYTQTLSGNFLTNEDISGPLFREEQLVPETSNIMGAEFEHRDLNMIEKKTSPKLTSSVPESHSAIVEDVVPPEEVCVSDTLEESSVAQVNTKLGHTIDYIASWVRFDGRTSGVDSR